MIKQSRLIFMRCAKYQRLLLLVGFSIYCLVDYRLIRGLDSHQENHPKYKHRGDDFERIKINREQALRLQRSSSIDYFSCCGAGHRLSKLADAYYLAKQLGLTVRVFFGFCGLQEVFSYLFGPKPLNEAQILDKIVTDLRAGKDLNSTPDMFIKVSNEVPGFSKITRTGYANSTACPCIGPTGQRFHADIELFSDLRDKRFRARDKVNSFREKHFADRTVIGLHVRAGNGEKGNFQNKNRVIEDTDQWCLAMSITLVSLSKDFEGKDPPLLFIATDTVTILSKLRTLLEGKMEVVDYHQDRVDHGKGVLFGGMGDVNTNGDKCKTGWVDSFVDMMLLSYADVLVAGRPSSFTQSLPMTLVLSTPKSTRNIRKSFCEVDPSATRFMCFEDLQDWCCNGNTSFSLNKMQKCDFRRMPQVKGLDLEGYKKQLVMRPRTRDACIPSETLTGDCLPYEMPDEKSLSKTRKRQEGRSKIRRKRDN